MGGAQVDVVDFKTGAMRGCRLALRWRGSASLQLGLYLAAVATLGVAGGRVWMLKPEAAKPFQPRSERMPEALHRLPNSAGTWRRALRRAHRRPHGFSHGYEWRWPARRSGARCWEKKFAATFRRRDRGGRR